METAINPDQPIGIGEILDSIPVHNEALAVEEHSDDGVLLKVPLKKKWYTGFPFSFFMPISKYRAVALDTTGEKVWNACDGITTTESIIERFARFHLITFHEARLCVVEYLRLLTRRGLLVMIGTTSQEKNH
ncbi:MAG: PqqD family peptide modification chaperone [Chitinivibrionales bacterium]|nr:PqqD family peptide modification chaperone [Chitinivibrionales bacterium]